MNIQAISSAMRTAGCQPIRNQNFEGLTLNSNFKSNEDDVFTPSDSYTQEQKLDLACRLAAFYQTKYEELQQKTGCCV